MTTRRTPADVVAQLRGAGRTVATAESLTGGLVCAALTDVPGASAVVRGGVVSYATDLKVSLLGVDEDVLAAPGGAVQPRVAQEMALGVTRSCSADLGVATTGVAGPDPQDGQPVGTVFVAVALAGQAAGEVAVRALQLGGDRSEIRRDSVAEAVHLLGQVIEAVGASGWTRGAGRAEDSGRGFR